MSGHSAEKGLPEPPVRLCCGQRHNGAMCPDGKVMCCACFERFDRADLVVVDGDTYDVCGGCASSVFPPGSDPTTDHSVYRCECITDDHEKPHAYVTPPGEGEGA